MPEDDDYAAQLASLDRNQLAELMHALGDRQNQEFAFTDPRDTTTAPQQYQGLGGPKSLSGMNDMSEKEKFRNGPGRFSAVGQYKHHKRSKAAKKKKKAYETSLRDESARQKQLLAERLKQVQGHVKTLDLRDKTNQQFRDMELEGLFDRVVKDGLDKSLLGITQQHQDLTRETGFQAVGQGLGGSSVDAERVADIGASQNQATIQAAAQAQQTRGNLSQDLDNQRRSLLSGISGSNPGEEARLSGQLQNIQSNASNYANQLGAQQYGAGLNSQQLAGQSQALGGLLSNYARLYTQDQQNQR